MKTYHKIMTVFKRDHSTNKLGKVLVGEYSLPEFEYLKDNEWVWTEKVDGTNIRIMYENGSITFGGKTDNAQIPAPLVNKLSKMFLTVPKIQKFIEVFDEAKQVCLYGEGFGPKIQKGGGNYRSDPGFVLFDIWIDGWWLKRTDVGSIAQQLGIDIVPIVGVGTIEEMTTKVRNGMTSMWGDFIAEGIVARPNIELKCRNGNRIITKLKYKDFARLNEKENKENS